VNLVKYIDKEEEEYILIRSSILISVNLRSKYIDEYITNTKNFIKYALLCLDDHNDNSYLLLKKKYENAKNYSDIFDDGDDIQDEAGLSQKADEYYTKFKTLVKNLVENIGKDNIIEDNDKNFKDYMYDIYSDGIILLTVYDNYSQDNLILYTKNSTETYEYNNKTKVLNFLDFFKVKRDCLIIKKYTYDTSNENYLYDCMLQIINKLARTLLEKLDDSTLDKKGTFSKASLENAVEAGAAAEDGDGEEVAETAEEEAADAIKEAGAGEKPATENEVLLQNVKKFVDIIYNKYKESAYYDEDYNLKITRHSILLKSLKIIMLNKLGEKKGITFEDVDNIYSDKILKKLFYGIKYNIDKVISSSKITYNKVLKEACTNNRRIESFQHIINVIYDENDENGKNNENIKMLKNISSGLMDLNCDDTINKIIRDKTYILSQAYILRTNINNYINENPTILTDNSSESDTIKHNLINPYHYLILLLSTSHYSIKIKDILMRDYKTFQNTNKKISKYLPEI
jgi:hypothetical protein